MKTVDMNSIWIPALLENLFLEDRLDAPENYETFSIPATNIRENLTTFVVEIAAPGIRKEDFEIEVEEDTLKISAKQASEEDKTSTYRKREFDYKNFERSFKLPENIETDKIQANYENGVLKVTLPKIEKKVFKKMVEIS